MRRRLSYANVTATLALVFAMSGGALAANHYLINSTKQINPKVLKKLTGKTGATGTAGAAGATGSQGPTGKEGAAGKEGGIGKEGKEGSPGKNGANGATNVVTRFTETTIKPGEDIYGEASCNAGEKITGGGFGITGAAYNNSFVIRSGLTYVDPQGGAPGGTWLAGVHSSNEGTLRVWAICASP